MMKASCVNLDLTAIYKFMENSSYVSKTGYMPFARISERRKSRNFQTMYNNHLMVIEKATGQIHLINLNYKRRNISSI